MATAKKTTRKRDPYANKKIAFDSLSISMQKNPVGTIGFFLTIASIVFGWIPVTFLMIIFGLVGLAGLVMSIIGMFKKPNGLPLIGLIIFGVEFVLGLVIGIIVGLSGGFY